MQLDSVRQLQTMNFLMKKQFDAYPVRTAMILGIAGGNGAEHIDPEKYNTVYGVDINADYLRTTSKRYSALSGVLKCLHLDLINENDKLPQAELVIANLLIEYIGYAAFQNVILKVQPKYVSCVIQINTDTEKWVSDSLYLHAFDRLDEVHTQMEASTLTDAMKVIGYSLIMNESIPLPNGKALQRLDFELQMYLGSVQQKNPEYIIFK